MVQVKHSRQADWVLGLIEGRNKGNPERVAEIRKAYHRIVHDLRSDAQWVWLIQSELYAGTFELSEPPLKAHFRRIHDNIIGIIDFQELDY